jgi:hypothetical protein
MELVMEKFEEKTYDVLVSGISDAFDFPQRVQEIVTVEARSKSIAIQRAVGISMLIDPKYIGCLEIIK